MSSPQDQRDPLFTLRSQAGVRRDGTELDSPFYADAVWTRFQRGKPRKIGGYAQICHDLNMPIRSVFVDARNGSTIAHYFGDWGIQSQLLNGITFGTTIDRTPLSFAANGLLTWSHAVMYSSTGGSYAALLAAATPDVLDITSDTGGLVYAGNAAGTDPLAAIADGSGPISVSGGLTVLQPFLVVYGSNGLIRNSNANDFSTATGWTTGGANKANTANVAGTKIVHGAPIRGGGQSPAGLFWALDAVIRMSYSGSGAIWNYDTLSQPTSILGKKTVVEHDGKFFWIGTDRFLFYNGVVQELPNQMNCNYFFENLNYAHRNKVWGTKIGRYGEIWWFYPRGSDTECHDAIIFNYLENTWYDARCERSAGISVQTFQNPIWAGDEDDQATTALTVGGRLAMSAQTLGGSNILTFVSTTGVANGQKVTGHSNIPAGVTVIAFTATTITMSAVALGTIPSGTVITFSSMTTAFVAGQVATGGTSGATGTVVRVSELQVNVENVAGTFVNGETITGGGGATAILLASPFSQTLGSVYAHEYGWNKITQQDTYSIRASFNTCNFGLAIGDPFGQTTQTMDCMTRVTCIEPDFDATGPLEVNLVGKSYASQPYQELFTEEVTAEAPFVSPRAQERILQIQVVSDSVGGFFQQGQVLVALEPGDTRGSS